MINSTGGKRTIRQQLQFSVEPTSPRQLIRDSVMEAIGHCRLVDQAAGNAVWFRCHSEWGFEIEVYFFTTYDEHVEAQTEVANLLWSVSWPWR